MTNLEHLRFLKINQVLVKKRLLQIYNSIITNSICKFDNLILIYIINQYRNY